MKGRDKGRDVGCWSAALLESQVRDRTRDLERSLDLLQESNAQLAAAHAEREHARANLREAIEAISEGFALFDSNDCLVLFNSRFCQYKKHVKVKKISRRLSRNN